MLTWLMNNAGTILIGLALILVVGLILCGMYRERKSGKGGCCSCGGGCGSCGMACHGTAGGNRRNGD